MRATHLKLLSLLALCSSCAQPPPQVCNATERRFERYVRPGEPVALTVGFDVQCQSGPVPLTPSLVADEVTAEVWNPDDQAVPFTVTKPVRSPGDFFFDNTAVLTFTPERPGKYRVNATFEPGIGRSQQVIEVVSLKTDAGERTIPVTLPENCVQYAITDLGTVLCTHSLRNTGRADDEVALDTHRGQRFSGIQYAVDQNVVWRLAGDEVGTLERLVDNGLSLESTHRRPGVRVEFWHPMAAGNGALWLASGNLLGLTESFLIAVRPAPDGGLDIDQKLLTNFVPGGVTANATATRIFGGTKTGERAVLSYFPDGGSARVTASGEFAGADSESLWFSTTSGTLMALQQVGNAQLRGSLTLPAGASGVRLGGILSPATPIVSGPLVVVPRFDGTSIALENYEPGVGFHAVSSATGRHAFARSLDGKSVKIFDR
jgi:hypothetical protein